ncbi:MAG: hypothetical protein JW994_02935, partial [Candidatus Omnitrophica bacterium]|nr:hypothetical protein [Candidatus Omnitrophota bacterium]
MKKSRVLFRIMAFVTLTMFFFQNICMAGPDIYVAKTSLNNLQIPLVCRILNDNSIQDWLKGDVRAILEG